MKKMGKTPKMIGFSILAAGFLSACASNWSTSMLDSSMETPIDVQLILLADTSVYYGQDGIKVKDVQKRSSLAYNNYVQAIVRTPGELSQYDGRSVNTVALGANLLGSANADVDTTSKTFDGDLGKLIGIGKGIATVARRTELSKRIMEQVDGRDVVELLEQAVEASNFSEIFTSQDAPVKWSIVQDYRGDVYTEKMKSGRMLSKHYPLPDKALSAKYTVIVKLGEIITGKSGSKAVAFNPVSVAFIDSASREVLFNSVLLTEPMPLPSEEKGKPFMTAALNQYYGADLKMKITAVLNEMLTKEAVFGKMK